MGLLSNEYRQELLNKLQSQPAVKTPGINTTNITPTRKSPDISAEEQTKKFGGEVGSVKYLKHEAERPAISRLPMEIGKSFGLEFPDQDVWDKMKLTDKISHTAYSAGMAGFKMLLSLPKEIVKAPVRAGFSLYQQSKGAVQGKTPQEIAQMKPLRVPWLGEIPNYFKTYEEAKASGLGPIAASITAGGLALGDVTIAASLFNAAKEALQPRATLRPGEKIEMTEPIKRAIAEDEGVLNLTKKIESTSEYYTLSKTTAKNFGGTNRDTFFKVTPAGADSVEISVVKLRRGKIPETVDWAKSKLGILPEKSYTGDFGKEIKIESQIVKLSNESNVIKREIPMDIQEASSNAIQQLSESQAGFRYSTEEGAYKSSPSTFPDWVPEGLRSKSLFDSLINKVSSNIFEFTKKEKQLVSVLQDYIAEKTSRNVADIQPEYFWNQFETIVLKQKTSEQLLALKEKPLKGFENKPITSEQINHIKNIGVVNGIDSTISDVVMSTITGKKVIGELTQAEYIETAKTLATFNNLSKYAPEAGSIPLFTRYFSPQRHWTRSLEEKTGIPIYSEAYVPLEDATRVRDVFRNSYREQAREIYGNYAKSGFAEERRLIKSYLEGDTAVITENSTISATVKQDLIEIAEKMKPLWYQVGERFGIEPEVFLKNYQPHIQEIGGIYQLYKKGSDLPQNLSFFAEFKRRGSLNVQVDDSLALFDIYLNAGSNKLFLNPVLDKIGALGNSLPSTLKDSLRSYVLEKMGYGGVVEEFLDKAGVNLNKKMGTNLPPDVGRQLNSLILDTVYSGGLSSPASWFRNFLQYDLLVYPRLGPKFYVDAARKSVTKAGIEEVRQAGFLVDLGVPYGTEIAEDITLFGKLGNHYRRGTQATIKPFSLADNVVRTRTYFQGKMIFEDALGRFNQKKINWMQTEQELDLQAFSSIDRNIIRQKLVSGDTQGAFEHYIRNIIDDTNFPYRRGSSSRITYGLSGKLGTTFLQWPIEYGHTMFNWIKTGQYDKLIRWYAASTAVQRTLKETFGFDFINSVYTGPFNPNFSPFMQTGLDVFEATKAWMNDSAELLDENKTQLTKTLKSLGRPAGVQINNWNRFWFSYNKGIVGPNGQYGVYDDKGRLRYYADFKELWWQLFGFPTIQKTEQAELQQRMSTEKFNYDKTKQQILQLWQREEYDKANQLMTQYGIVPSSSDFDKYYIPLTQRTWEMLPLQLKAKFAPSVFK